MESAAPNTDDLAQDELWAAEAKGALRQSAAVGVADAWGDERQSPSTRSASLLPETFAAGPVRGRFGRKGRRSQPRQPEPQPEPDGLDLGPEVHSGRRLDLDMEPFEPAPPAAEAADAFEPQPPVAPAPGPEPVVAAPPSADLAPAPAPEPPAASAAEPAAAPEAPAPVATTPAFRDPLDDVVESAPIETPSAAALSPAPLAPLPVEASPVPAGSPAEPTPVAAPVADASAAPALTGWDTLFDSFDPPSADPLAGPDTSTSPASLPAPTQVLPTAPAADAAPDPEPAPASAPAMPPIWGKHPDEQSPEKPPVIDPW